MQERGLSMVYTTLYRWVVRYAPEIHKRLAWYKRRYAFGWYIDETYINVKGEWKYLYRALDDQGNTLDFYLSHRRNTKAAKRFLKKLINHHLVCDVSAINTDKSPTYPQTIADLKQDGSIARRCPAHPNQVPE